VAVEVLTLRDVQADLAVAEVEELIQMEVALTNQTPVEQHVVTLVIMVMRKTMVQVLEEEPVTKEITVVETKVAKAVKVLQAVLQDLQSHTVVAEVDLLGTELEAKVDLAAAVKVDKTLVAAVKMAKMELVAEAAEVAMLLVVKAEMEE
jgi:hypothetical protein